MDSKLQKIAILSSLAAILIVTLSVFWWNREDGTAKVQQPAEITQAGWDGDESAQTEPSIHRDPNQIGENLSAFEEEEGFFDPERNAILEAAKDMSNRVTLMVTSVEKDLRIQVLDETGELVKKTTFLINLEKVKTSEQDEGEDKNGIYKDLDQDGVIYIADLAAGEYQLALEPVTGYRVPAESTRVRVKDKVEYLAIKDISLLIKTEEEVDAQAEDSGQKDALEDADQSEITKFAAFTGKTRSGIDVSKWNGTIDWDKAKNAGVEFAIVRAGYRGSVTGSLVQDICFEANMKGAARAGIPVGVYFFTQATNEVEAVEEASAVLRWIQEYEITYPVFIDTEGAGGKGRADQLDADSRTQVCEAFCRTIENAGYQAGIYASRNWYNNNLYTQKLENYYIWLAEYRSVPLYQGYYRMWQYSSKGKIDGIEGNVDMNVMYE